MHHDRATTFVGCEGCEEISTGSAAAHAKANHAAPGGLTKVIQPRVAFSIHGLKPVLQIIMERLGESNHAFGVQPVSKVNQCGLVLRCCCWFHHASSCVGGSSIAMNGRASHASS